MNARSETKKLRPPRISILLPAFDAAETLLPCLRSIRRQTETSWECVAVDDGSRDDTGGLLRETADRDPRFRVVRQAHRGLVAALNTGLERCRGDYVARMDADDLMHRCRLAEQRCLLERSTDVAAVGCHVRIFPRGSVGPGLREYEQWLNGLDGPDAVRREAFVECPIAHPTWMIRREILRELGYRDEGWPEDYDLLLRLLSGDRKVGVLTRRRLMWRHGPGRLSLASPLYGRERFTACKAEFLSTTYLSGHDRYVLWGYGATGKSLCRALERQGKRPSHIVELHPGRLGNRIRGAAVISPDELTRLPSGPLLVSVARAGPRAEIRAALNGMGFVELRDYVCAA